MALPEILEAKRKQLEEMKEGFDETQEKLWDTSVFLAKMLLAGSIFQAILFLYPDTVPIQSFLAEWTAFAARIIGLEAYSQGIDIYIGAEIYRISQDCLGWKSIAAFTALIYASSDSLSNNLRFVSIGILAIIAANFVRIITTVYLGHLEIISFSLVHGIFWKWGLTLVILVLWLVWLNQRADEPLYRKL